MEVVCYNSSIFIVFTFIGLLLYTFYEGADIFALGLRTQDEIFVKYIVEQIPSGVSGLIVAALFAAAMSSLSSSLNALASTTLYDVIIPYRKKVFSAVEELNLSRKITLYGVLYLVLQPFYLPPYNFKQVNVQRWLNWA